MKKHLVAKISKIYEKNKNIAKQCYCPEPLKGECSRKIINSHTVSKSSNLKPISRNGHVYSFDSEKQRFSQDSLQAQPILKGINQASTFCIFCEKHDLSLFVDFENNQLKINQKHNFLIFYRSLVQEIYKKKKIYKNFTDILGNMQTDLSTDSLFMLTEYKKGCGIAIRDLEKLKSILDNELIDQKYSNIHYYVIVLDKIPEIMSSCVWIPTKDFNDNLLFDLNNVEQIAPIVSINTVVFENNKGAVFIAWHKNFDNGDYCKNFVDSFHKITDDKKGIAILNWLFSCNENIFLCPDWWDDLSIDKKQYLKDKFFYSLKAENDCILGDYFNLQDYVSWKVIDLKTNIVQ